MRFFLVREIPQNHQQHFLIPNGSHLMTPEIESWNILKSKLEVLKYKSERIPIWHLLPTKISDWLTFSYKGKKQCGTKIIPNHPLSGMNFFKSISKAHFVSCIPTINGCQDSGVTVIDLPHLFLKQGSRGPLPGCQWPPGLLHLFTVGNPGKKTFICHCYWEGATSNQYLGFLLS